MKKLLLPIVLLLAPLSAWAQGTDVPLMDVDLETDPAVLKQGAEVALSVHENDIKANLAKIERLKKKSFTEKLLRR